MLKLKTCGLPGRYGPALGIHSHCEVEALHWHGRETDRGRMRNRRGMAAYTRYVEAVCLRDAARN